jgi:hypothetical protein
MNLVILYQQAEDDVVWFLKAIAGVVGFSVLGSGKFIQADALLILVTEGSHLDNELERARANQKPTLVLLESGDSWPDFPADSLISMLDLREVARGGPYEIMLTEGIAQLHNRTRRILEGGDPEEPDTEIEIGPLLSEISPWLRALESDDEDDAST